jgi:hypothetical protein
MILGPCSGTLVSYAAPQEGDGLKVTRARTCMIVFVTAAFLVVGAQAAFGVSAPAEQSVGTTGAQSDAQSGVQQATSVCPEPRLSGLPKRPKFTNATIHFKLLDMTQGAGYLVKAGKGEVLAGYVPQAGTVKNSFQLPDQGVKSRTIPIEVVISNDQCENAPWKVTKKIRYKAVTPPAAPTTPQTPAAAQPGAPSTAKPVPVTPVKPVKPITPVSALPKLPPKGPSLKIRTWATPLDGGSRLVQAPLGPKLSRTERRADKAKSSTALIGLGALFLLSGIGGIGALAILKRNDERVISDAFAVLPQHLEEGSPDMPQSGEEPDTAQLSAHMLEAATPVAPLAPAMAQVEENDRGDSTHHREEVEAELQKLLAEAGIDAHLEGILTDAREEAARQGIALDSNVILQAIGDELNGTEGLSEAKRGELRAMFASIVAEEAERIASEEEPDTAQADTAQPDTAQPDAEEVAPVAPLEAAVAQVEENGNGSGDSTLHREETEAELRKLLAEAGIDAHHLEGILADAREEAARQGIALDSNMILQAIGDELNGTADFSEAKRGDLRAMFESIVAEEAERVPQQT